MSISYYVKGQVIGFLLDAHIRGLTKGARSLDDVMRAAYARYSGARGFTPDQFRQVAEQVAGASLADFWSSWISGMKELDYGNALSTFGLRFRRGWQRPCVAWRDDPQRQRPARRHRRRRERAAGTDTLVPDDEILAINERRVRPDQLARRLDDYARRSRHRVDRAQGPASAGAGDSRQRTPAPLGNRDRSIRRRCATPAAYFRLQPPRS